MLLPTIDTSNIIPGGIRKINGDLYLGRVSSGKNATNSEIEKTQDLMANKTRVVVEKSVQKRSLVSNIETSTVPAYEFYQFSTPLSPFLDELNNARGYFYLYTSYSSQ